jgi:hypothetical protein
LPGGLVPSLVEMPEFEWMGRRRASCPLTYEDLARVTVKMEEKEEEDEEQEPTLEMGRRRESVPETGSEFASVAFKLAIESEKRRSERLKETAEQTTPVTGGGEQFGCGDGHVCRDCGRSFKQIEDDIAEEEEEKKKKLEFVNEVGGVRRRVLGRPVGSKDKRPRRRRKSTKLQIGNVRRTAGDSTMAPNDSISASEGGGSGSKNNKLLCKCVKYYLNVNCI